MKIRIKTIQDWFKEAREINEQAKNLVGIDMYNSWNNCLDFLQANIDNLDINYIDERESRNRSIYRIAEHYGFRHQLDKMEEELIECLHAAREYRKFASATKASPENDKKYAQIRSHLIEEMGDVRIMIKQIEFIMDAHDDVNKSIDDKIIRTFEQIDEESKALNLDLIRENNR